jgi:hypothetical protein
MRSLLSFLALRPGARTNGITGLRIHHLDAHIAGFGVQPVAK